MRRQRCSSQLVRSVLLFGVILCIYGDGMKDSSFGHRTGSPRRALEGLLEHPTRLPLFATRGSAARRALLAAKTQQKCYWYPDPGSYRDGGTCELNEYFILTLQGRPPSISARIMAYMQYKAIVCMSYSTEAACYANPTDKCSWDLGHWGGDCYVSESVLYDPEVLRGNLYCKNSLLDTAVGCALTAPKPASGGGSVNCTSSAAGADCVYLSEAQLEGDKLSTAAMPYIRLIDLVSYTSTDTTANTDFYDAMGEGGGVCVARWLLQADTLARLQRTVAANPQYGLLQPDLLGTCSSKEWLVTALLAVNGTCLAAGGGVSSGGGGGDPYERRMACRSTTGCRWDYAGDSCQPGYDMLFNAIFTRQDPWVRALWDAQDYCNTAGAGSRAACEAAAAAVPPLNVDLTRMATLQFALTSPKWTLNGASAPVRGGGSLSWLMAIGGAAAAALLGGGRSGWPGGGI